MAYCVGKRIPLVTAGTHDRFHLSVRARVFKRVLAGELQIDIASNISKILVLNRDLLCRKENLSRSGARSG